MEHCKCRLVKKTLDVGYVVWDIEKCKLCKSAPKLLEALEGFVKQANKLSGFSEAYEPYLGALINARAAIKQAKEGGMKPYNEYEIDLPVYSASYLINGDASGLEDDDIKEIDSYMEGFYVEAKRVNGHVVIDIGEEEEEFTHMPAFGLACNTVSATITIFSGEAQ